MAKRKESKVSREVVWIALWWNGCLVSHIADFSRGCCIDRIRKQYGQYKPGWPRTRGSTPQATKFLITLPKSKKSKRAKGAR